MRAEEFAARFASERFPTPLLHGLPEEDLARTLAQALGGDDEIGSGKGS